MFSSVCLVSVLPLIQHLTSSWCSLSYLDSCIHFPFLICLINPSDKDNNMVATTVYEIMKSQNAMQIWPCGCQSDLAAFCCRLCCHCFIPFLIFCYIKLYSTPPRPLAACYCSKRHNKQNFQISLPFPSFTCSFFQVRIVSHTTSKLLAYKYFYLVL